MSRWIGLLLLGATLVAGCAEYHEMRRLKNETSPDATEKKTVPGLFQRTNRPGGDLPVPDSMQMP